MRRSTSAVAVLLLPFFIFYGVFVLLPTLGLVLKSFSGLRDLGFEIFDLSKLRDMEWTLRNYIEVFGSSFYLKSTLNTVFISLIAVAICFVVGTPIAYLLALKGSRWTKMVGWFIMLPVYLPGVLASYALFIFFGSNGLVAAVSEFLTSNPIRLVYTWPGVIFGTAYIVLPMFIRTAKMGFERIRGDIKEASHTLGAPEFYTFVKVLFPIAAPSILAALIITFTYTMSLVVVVLILGGGGRNISILPVEIMNVAQSMNFDIPKASAMSVVLLIIAFIGQYLATWIMERDSKRRVGVQ